MNKELNCNVQFGGSDQWGNIINGIDLIKKATPEDNKNVHAITSPLITTSNGKKMGKTAKAQFGSQKKIYQYLIYGSFGGIHQMKM